MDTELAKLVEIERIRRLKYAYLRTLDTKRWDEMATLFTEDVESRYSDGAHTYSGREAVLGFLRGALGDPRIVSQHQVHHPEIDVEDDLVRARGTWYLHDRVLHPGKREGSAGFEVTGTAFYEETYVKQEGAWRIRTIGYTRVYEEITKRDAASVISFKTCFDPK